MSGKLLTWAECRGVARWQGLTGATGVIYAALLMLRGVRWE